MIFMFDKIAEFHSLLHSKIFYIISALSATHRLCILNCVLLKVDRLLLQAFRASDYASGVMMCAFYSRWAVPKLSALCRRVRPHLLLVALHLHCAALITAPQRKCVRPLCWSNTIINIPAPNDSLLSGAEWRISGKATLIPANWISSSAQ